MPAQFPTHITVFIYFEKTNVMIVLFKKKTAFMERKDLNTIIKMYSLQL